MNVIKCLPFILLLKTPHLPENNTFVVLVHA